MYVNRGIGERPGNVADTAGVVKVDVRHGDAGEVLGAETVAGQGLQQSCGRALAAGFDQDGSGPFDEVARRHPFPASEQRVYLEDAGSDIAAHQGNVSARHPGPRRL